MRPVKKIYALTLLAVASLSGAQAAAIHKWVDDKGVTHYSDAAPQTPATAITRLDIDTRRESPAALTTRPDDYYSIANQWQRLHQESLQRQQLELQRAALRNEQPADTEAAADYRESVTTRYVVAYPRHHHRRYLKRKHAYAQENLPEPTRPTGINHTSNRPQAGGFATTN